MVRFLLVIAGGIAFFVAGLFVHQSSSPYPDGISTVGTITDMRSWPTKGGGRVYMAIYTFTTIDGRSVSFEDPASGSHRPTVGDEVTVSYPAAAPERARRVPGFDWFGWAVIAVGSGIGGLGLYDFVRAAQRSAARADGAG